MSKWLFNNRTKTQLALISIMTPEKKWVKLKGETGTLTCKAKMYEPIVDEKEKSNHSVTQCHNQSERKALLYIYSERR